MLFFLFIFRRLSHSVQLQNRNNAFHLFDTINSVITHSFWSRYVSVFLFYYQMQLPLVTAIATERENRNAFRISRAQNKRTKKKYVDAAYDWRSWKMRWNRTHFLLFFFSPLFSCSVNYFRLDFVPIAIVQCFFFILYFFSVALCCRLFHSH